MHFDHLLLQGWNRKAGTLTPGFSHMCSALALLLWPAFIAAQTPLTADEIMQKVAVNQDRAEKLRTEYIYEQKVASRAGRQTENLPGRRQQSTQLPQHPPALKNS